MLAQQQVRLLGGQSRLVCKLMRSLLWDELLPSDRRKVGLFLSRIEHDSRLAALVARPVPSVANETVTQKAALRGGGRVPAEARRCQEALP